MFGGVNGLLGRDIFLFGKKMWEFLRFDSLKARYLPPSKLEKKDALVWKPDTKLAMTFQNEHHINNRKKFHAHFHG